MATMGVKTGTKTWNDTPRDIIQKPDNTQTMSATDREKLGEEDIGSTLNKLADPNFIDRSKKLRTVGNDKMDKDAFMKLMLAQMKNQDPSNPLKSHEMAAQLAQFTSVEQMMNMNQTLNELKNAQKPVESFQALNFIGKSVSGDSAKVVRLKGDKNHDFTFDLPADAATLQLKIRNQNGDVVRTVDLKNLKKGANTYVWNGQDERGTQAPVGEYQFFVEAKNSNGKKLAVKTDFEGQITGVSYTNDGPVLLVGTQSVKLKDVRKIVDPAMLAQKNSAQPQVAQDLKNPNAKEDNNNKGAQEVPVTPGGNIFDNVAMSGEVMKKLEKETQPEAVKTADAASTGSASASQDLPSMRGIWR